MTHQSTTRPKVCPACGWAEVKAQSADWCVTFECGNLVTYHPSGEWQYTQECSEAYRVAVGCKAEIAKAVRQAKAEERERVLILIENWETGTDESGWQDLELGARRAAKAVRELKGE